MKNLSQKKKKRPRVFLPQSNLFLAIKNIYSMKSREENVPASLLLSDPKEYFDIIVPKKLDH